MHVSGYLAEVGLGVQLVHGAGWKRSKGAQLAVQVGRLGTKGMDESGRGPSEVGGDLSILEGRYYFHGVSEAGKRAGAE